MINSINFSLNNSILLLGTQAGHVIEVKVPKFNDCNFQDTYLMTMEKKSYTIKMMES